ncbi:MAG: hypothetical protein WA705_16250 [Candidatus Ozemobacteraceae bacterium]
MNVRKYVRGSFFVCLLCIMSIALTGCDIAKVLEFVKTVVSAATTAFGSGTASSTAAVSTDAAVAASASAAVATTTVKTGASVE